MKLIVWCLFAMPLLAHLTVAVSIEPQRWIVSRVAGDLATVVVMQPPNATAHTFEPKPKQMIALSTAAVYLLCGVEFESVWQERFRAQNKNLVFVQTDSAIEKIGFEEHDHDDHSIDTHIWLSPRLIISQARAIAAAFAKHDPANAEEYQANFARLERELESLNDAIAKKLKPFKGREFLVFHPSLGYFAHDFGLIQRSIEFEGKEPKPAQLAEMIKTAKASGTSVIFVERGYNSKTAQMVANAIGARIVEIDLINGDLTATLKTVADELVKAFGDRAKS
ncbi:cation ABC transporter substrate-binding protein [Campylobacterota bacterium]|nr:cation ABC transporter substrate-binding protein [Campylobacterota bacterium]